VRQLIGTWQIFFKRLSRQQKIRRCRWEFSFSALKKQKASEGRTAPPHP
jgi:hypothetical protein